ncbi:uncharacterized protein LOC118198688 isoform X2 [Stegodyphus dumicola]|uniref:uncharacterized protein LOC118198688 isoform X2 n=1 Tax=Stegodyphus dumicola TaxID=202533 RepID=UPI0015B0CE93|nr:uncharacterized protein LOC118198688 isoform X2 [Stegodyphus dumicola]
MNNPLSGVRQKQVLKQYNENYAKTNVLREKNASLENIDDLLIVHKIQEKEEKYQNLSNSQLTSDVVDEQQQLAEEYETIVKKQLQMLLADERGKQALNAEIAEIKKKQKKRAEAFRARKHALDIEKERSRRIAALPPPLPQSVKDLLKKSGSVPLSEQETAAVSEKYELKDDKIDISEDKENALDSGTKESKMKLSEELNKKAKMRFNEALKKDRQKQECEEILKNIESAELQARRQMAKNVTEKGKIPCLIPDRMEGISKQLAMETAVENISKKSKEHAIEDLEGYEDEWEKKYGNYSDMESKMIDCIPSFIKENYFYLLEDETSHQCGKRFTGLDTEDDFLNIAYIEDSPTETGSTNECEDISTVISHLDKMRSELKTTYEEQIKPLLEAEQVASRRELSDKAIEADILKLPAEDKAVEIDEKMTEKLTSSRSIQVNLTNGGVMAFKRRPHGFIFNKKIEVNEREHRENNITPDSWSSSSSYLSLPSKLGPENILDHKLQNDDTNHTPEKTAETDSSSKCLREMIDKNSLSSKESLLKSNQMSCPEKKPEITLYVKKLAEKYLGKLPAPSVSTNYENQVSSSSDYKTHLYQKSEPESNIMAFRKERVASFTETNMSSKLKTLELNKKNYLEESIQGDENNKFSEQLASKSNQEGIECDPFHERSIDVASSLHEFVNVCEAESLKALPRLYVESDKSLDPEKYSQFESNVENSFINSFPEQMLESIGKTSPKPHVYHELSTIQEMDSALTNEAPKVSLDSNESMPSENDHLSIQSKENDKIRRESAEMINTACVSLLSPPCSEQLKLAKGIRFVSDAPKDVQSVLELPEKVLAVNITPVSSENNVICEIKSKPRFSGTAPSSPISTETNVLSSSKCVSSPNGSHAGLLTSEDDKSVSEFNQERKENYYGFENYPHLSDTSSFKGYWQPNEYFSHENKIDDQCGQPMFTEHSELFNATDEKFKILTPHSNVSSPEATCNQDLKLPSTCILDLKENKIPYGSIVGKYSTSGFMPMTPQSNISTPNSASAFEMSVLKSPVDNCNQNTKFQKPNTETVNFSETNNLMPSSSPLIVPSNLYNVNKDLVYNNTSSLRPVTLTFDICLNNQKGSSEHAKIISPSKIKCHLDMKSTHISSKHMHAHDMVQEHENSNRTIHTGNHFDKYKSSRSPMEYKHFSSESAQCSGSGFFVPTLCLTDFSSFESLKDSNVPQVQTNLIQSVKAEGVIAKSYDKGKSSKQEITTQMSDKKVSDLKGASSNSTSIESLSEMFTASKIAFQSTPIKSLEEIIKEPGIMEEPDLTLINSQFSVALDSIEKPRALSDLCSSNSAKYTDPIDDVEEMTLHLTESRDKALKTQIPGADGESLCVKENPYADSPSMVSFLQHEMSCLEASCEKKVFIPEPVEMTCKNNESPLKIPVTMTTQSEGMTPISKPMHFKTTANVQFRRCPVANYKKNTKRLWNNLEEVKKKKEAEEKRKLMAANRLKVKEFAKKITPKKK